VATLTFGIAGIFMFTGDFKLTAVAIARQVCIPMRASFRFMLMQYVLEVGIDMQHHNDTINNVRAFASEKDAEGVPLRAPLGGYVLCTAL
jgi:magnesium-transporting ATPase (P-type)